MKYFDTVKLHSRVPGNIFRMFVLEMVIKCIPDRSFLALKAIFYVSLFTFPCVIILSTHYGKLSSITTVFSPQKHIKIGIRQWQSVQGSQVLHPGLWILQFWVQDPGSFVLVLILDYARKNWKGEKKSVLNNTKTSNFKFLLFFQMPQSLYIIGFDSLTNILILILVFLDETSEDMFLLCLLQLAKTAYSKAYGNYLEELFHVKNFFCSKDFRRNMVEVLRIYVCIMRK